MSPILNKAIHLLNWAAELQEGLAERNHSQPNSYFINSASFFSSACPLKFLATIIPVGSMRKF